MKVVTPTVSLEAAREPPPLAVSAAAREFEVVLEVAVESGCEPPDRGYRSSSPRYPEVYTPPAENIPASEQVTSGDRFLHGPIRLKTDDVDTRSVVLLTHACRYCRDSITSAPDNRIPVSSERRLGNVEQAAARRGDPSRIIRLKMHKSKRDSSTSYYPTSETPLLCPLPAFLLSKCRYRFSRISPDRRMPGLRSLELGEASVPARESTR